MSVLNGPRVEPEGRAPQQLVMFLHGYGSNGDDLIGLTQAFQAVLPDAAWVSPNAPQNVPGLPGGYQWFGLEAARLDPEGMYWGCREASPILDAYINEELARYGLSDDKLALIGFSQGTMMALHIAMRRMEPLAGVLGYSGLLAGPDKLEEEMSAKPPVRLIHGDADDRIPVGMLTAAAEALKTVGVEVSGHVSPGVGHGIGPDGVQSGGEFLAKIFAT